MLSPLNIVLIGVILIRKITASICFLYADALVKFENLLLVSLLAYCADVLWCIRHAY